MTNAENSLSPLPAPSSRAELEFRRFAQQRAKNGIEPTEARLLTLILRRFTNVTPLGTAHGRRANWIVEHWPSAVAEDLDTLLNEAVSDAGEAFPVTSLTRLEIGPFRGFAQTEPIELDRPVSFVYGPNGTGKSSLCEGLEYAMLGFIEEAKAKRIDLAEYVKHVPSGDFQPPVLTAILRDGSASSVTADAAAFRFCFIEKNRIDAFARLSATTPAAQAHRIASLFGLEDFSHFVDGFTDNFEGYLTLLPLKPAELDQREREIAVHRETVEQHSERLAELSRAQDELARHSGLGVPFAQLGLVLYGEPEGDDAGRLAELDSLIERPAAYRQDELDALDLPRLEEATSSLHASLVKLTDVQSRLTEHAVEVGFSRLFEAVQGVRDIWTEGSCPACLTPLDQVVRDPFERAVEELDSLQELAAAEQELVAARHALMNQIEVVSVEFQRTNRVATLLGLESPLPSTEGLVAALAAGQPEAQVLVTGLLEDATAAGEALAEVTVSRDDALTALLREEAQRHERRTERDRLRLVATEMAALGTRAEQLEASLEVAREAVDGFEAERTRLLSEISDEAARIRVHEELLESYDVLIGKLRAYRDILPIVMVEDLAERTLEIYNLINAHDPPFEILEDLVLPQKVGEDLLVSFVDGTEQYVNALQVLSDGHLRCLGVAILLAKNLDEECGLIVFDDVVNAVDDDHRAGLADVLMDHPDVSRRQILITTHGREFVKTLSLRVTKGEFATRVRQIDFLVPTDCKGVVVDRHSEPTQYLVRSEGNIDRGRLREALGDHRRALEGLCAKLWKRLGRKYNASLTVRTRALRAPPDLRSVVDSLIAFLRNTVSSAADDAASQLVKDLETITDRWDELNKGIHEDEEQKEFDPVIVKEIQKALEGLENTLKTKAKEL